MFARIYSNHLITWIKETVFINNKRPFVCIKSSSAPCRTYIIMYYLDQLYFYWCAVSLWRLDINSHVLVYMSYLYDVLVSWEKL